jgi:hypothetical protein
MSVYVFAPLAIGAATGATIGVAIGAGTRTTIGVAIGTGTGATTGVATGLVLVTSVHTWLQPQAGWQHFCVDLHWQSRVQQPAALPAQGSSCVDIGHIIMHLIV